jgi:hypothetical protein
MERFKLSCSVIATLPGVNKGISSELNRYKVPEAPVAGRIGTRPVDGDHARVR